MRKPELRKLYLTKRATADRSEIRNKEEKIFRRFFDLIDPSGIKYLHHYVPIKGKNEFDALRLARKVRRSNPEVLMVVPRVNYETRELDHILFDRDTVFAESKLQIPEPVGGIGVDVIMIDAVIVPLLCFDRRGQRVGYGGGYYDRFLAKCRGDCLKIGTSFFEPADHIEGIHEADVRLDYCLTPDKTFDFLHSVKIDY